MYYAKEFAIILSTNTSFLGSYPEHCFSCNINQKATGVLQKTSTLQGNFDALMP